MLSTATDDELMALVKAGNSGAYDVLFDRHSNAVYGYCLRTLGGNRAMADDILQEVWFKVARQVSRYEPRGQFKAWLMTIARNETITQIRGQLILNDDRDSKEQEPSEDAGAEQNLLLQHDRRKVHNAIQSLPDTQRVVLMLAVIDELSYEEIAVQIGSKATAVRSLLHRARTELRGKLKKL